MYRIQYIENGVLHEGGNFSSLALALEAAIRRGLGNNSPDSLSFIRIHDEAGEVNSGS